MDEVLPLAINPDPCKHLPRIVIGNAQKIVATVSALRESSILATDFYCMHCTGCASQYPAPRVPQRCIRKVVLQSEAPVVCPRNVGIANNQCKHDDS